jgi:hypothetical protein
MSRNDLRSPDRSDLRRRGNGIEPQAAAAEEAAEPLRLPFALRRERPLVVRAAPAGGIAGVGVPEQVQLDDVPAVAHRSTLARNALILPRRSASVAW